MKYLSFWRIIFADNCRIDVWAMNIDTAKEKATNLKHKQIKSVYRI